MKTRRPEIITLGEALVEIMRPGSGKPLDETGSFQGPFASGAPAIFAVAAARFGMNARFIGTVGQDAFGRFLLKRLKTEGVDVSLVAHTTDLSTSAAFVAYSKGGQREFVFHIRGSAAGAIRESTLTADYFGEAQWLHISGSTLLLNESWRSAAEEALRLARAAGARLSLDPNLRPNLLPNEKATKHLEPWLHAADILFPTESEACALTLEPDGDAAAKKLLIRKDQVVVLKGGAAGCRVYGEEARIDVPGFPVTEVDPTGAGDAFAAAFIAGIATNLSIERSARLACAAGALAVTKLGPMEAIPTMNETQRFLRFAETI